MGPSAVGCVGAEALYLVVDNEINHLGPQMDLYLVSLGVALLTWSRRNYWAAYEEMIPALIRKDLHLLDDAISRLQPLVKAT